MPNPNLPKGYNDANDKLYFKDLEKAAELFNSYMMTGGTKAKKITPAPIPRPEDSRAELYDYINKLEIRMRERVNEITSYRRELMYEKARNLALQEGSINVQSFARAVNKALKRHGARVRLSTTSNQAALAAELSEILWNICGREAVED